MSSHASLILDAAAEVAVPPGNRFQSVDVNGMELHVVTLQESVSHILDCLDRAEGGWVITPNVDIVRRWNRSSDFRRTASATTLRVADGVPLVWASRLQGTPLPERVNGTNLSDELAAGAAERGRSVFLLGGAPGTADEACRQLLEKYPDLEIAGTYCPPYGFERDRQQMAMLVDAVCSVEPDIVLVGLGSPKQEVLIEHLRHRLPRTWWLGVGVTLSFLAGQIPRAPRWMQIHGLEWFYRLVHEPRRLARRYLVDDVPFFAEMLVRACWRRVFRLPSQGPGSDAPQQRSKIVTEK